MKRGRIEQKNGKGQGGDERKSRNGEERARKVKKKEDNKGRGKGEEDSLEEGRSGEGRNGRRRRMSVSQNPRNQAKKGEERGRQI